MPFTGYIHRLAYDGQWILLAREGGLVVLDAAGESIRSFVPEGSTGKKYWEPFFSPDGKELWLHESGSLSVERYELPSAVSTTQPTSKPASTTQPDN